MPRIDELRYRESTACKSYAMHPRRTIVFVCLLVSPALPWSEAQEPSSDPQTPPVDTLRLFDRIPKGLGLEIQAGVFFDQRPAPTLFTGIPQNLRTVPTHPDDGYPAGTMWTIPNPSYALSDPRAPGPTFYSIAPQYSFWRVSVRGGVRIVPAATISVTKPMAGDTIPEINQEGTAERGYGQSLVYYFLYWGPKATGQVRPFAEAELRVFRFVSIIGGFVPYRSESSVFLENGWDRYDAFETHGSQSVASIRQQSHGYYGALRLAIFGPYAGMRFGFTSMATSFPYLYPGVNPNFPSGASRPAAGVFWAVDLRLIQTKLPADSKK